MTCQNIQISASTTVMYNISQYFNLRLYLTNCMLKENYFFSGNCVVSLLQASIDLITRYFMHVNWLILQQYCNNFFLLIHFLLLISSLFKEIDCSSCQSQQQPPRKWFDGTVPMTLTNKSQCLHSYGSCSVEI